MTLLALLLTFSFETHTPPQAMDSARRAFNAWQFQNIGPFKEVRKGDGKIKLYWRKVWKHSLKAAYAVFTPPDAIEINADVYRWPLHEIALDWVYAHEIGHALGLGEKPVGVMRSPPLLVSAEDAEGVR